MERRQLTGEQKKWELEKQGNIWKCESEKAKNILGAAELVRQEMETVYENGTEKESR